METIRMLGMTICVTAVVTALFSMLVPNSNNERVLKFAVSLFFLTGLVSPFAAGGLDFHIDLGELEPPAAQAELSGAVGEQFCSLAERNVAAAVEKVLLAEGLPPKKVAAQINIGADGSISITRMEVLLPAELSGETARAALVVQRETGIRPDVVVAEEKNRWS